MYDEISFELTGRPPRTALVVEDDPRLLQCMRRQLGRAGFRVLSAHHYDAALLHLAARTPHVISIDVGLPAQSGYELCEYIRGPLGLANVPIIITSEWGYSDDMAFAEAAGGNAFLRKPFSARQFQNCVDSLLDLDPSSAPPEHELEQLASRALARAAFARGNAQIALAV
jgi:DNA-binding response OmpR family regulator